MRLAFMSYHNLAFAVPHLVTRKYRTAGYIEGGG